MKVALFFIPHPSYFIQLLSRARSTLTLFGYGLEEASKLIFNAPKPTHFGNHQHCCECAEHDETLLAHDVDSMSLEQLGNPGWDPLCFS